MMADASEAPVEGRPRVRVLLLSAVGTRVNPYIGLLREGLIAAGVEARLADRLPAAALAGPDRADVIHLHWLDRYDLPRPVRLTAWREAADWPRRAGRRLVETAGNLALVYQARRWLRLAALLRQLASFRAQGGRVVYTVHNLEPHEDQGWADRWATARLLRLADSLHVHDQSTAERIRASFDPAGPIAVIPHGHYLHSYPNTVDRIEARRRLDLPADAFVYVTLGLLRPYKGLEELLPAFRSLAAADARLLVAGQPAAADYVRGLEARAAADPRIRLVPHFVPSEEVQLFFNAADVGVLPYRQITTSGAALLAFSFGLPVIAPAIGAFPALLAGDAPPRGVLYDPAAPDGLARALAQARGYDWQAARPGILSWVAQFDWGEIGKALVELYRVC